MLLATVGCCKLLLATASKLLLRVYYQTPARSLRPHSCGAARYSAKAKYKIYGFEWGNEVGCATGGSLAEMESLVNRTWPNPDDRPALIGPDAIQYDIKDANATNACASIFFNGSRSAAVKAFTYHLYLQTHSTVYTADELDEVGRIGAPVRDAVRRLGGMTPTEVWMGEMGGHSGGGVVGVTDTFASHQWCVHVFGRVQVPRSCAIDTRA
jgi:hypothetical protein